MSFISPIETYGGYLIKRDDLFNLGGISDGHVETLTNQSTTTLSIGANYYLQLDLMNLVY